MARPIKVAFLVVDDRFKRLGTPPYFGPAPTAVLDGFRSFPDDIEVHIVCCTMGQPQGPDKLADNIWFHSIPVPKWGYIRSLYAGCIHAVRQMLSTIKPDLIHAQGTERWCAVSGSFFNGPKVLTLHGNLVQLNSRVKMRPRHYWTLQTYLQKLAVPRFDGVACVSSHVAECIATSAKRTWLIPNAIRPIFFSRSARVTRRNDRITFLNIGVFAPWKRQDQVLQLARRVWQRDPRVVFRFIGHLESDAFGTSCKTLIEEGESLGYVEYSKTKSTEEIIDELDSAHAIIHCPIEETFGLVVAESLARGLKFFGSSVGGVKDITRDVPGCCVQEEDDWNGLEQDILQWLAGPIELLPHATDLMRDRYSPEVAARNHLKMYHELLELHRRPN